MVQAILPLDSALEALHITQTSHLMVLPAELRVHIFEYIYELPTETTTIDLREDTPVQPEQSPNVNALELTSKQIRKECLPLRKYYVVAPIFGDSEGPLHSVQRQRVAGRLATVAGSTEATTKLEKSTMYLGHMGSLRKLRWTDMYSCWNRVLEAIVLMRDTVPGLILELRFSIEGGATAQYSFGVKNAEDMEKGMENGRMRDGNPVVLTEAEAEKLQKISKTLVRTMFPDRVRE